ncbi:MAG: serine hydroxymethyltransferase [Deltaproteobacteria bacterium]|nr:serine hydroxymethyltransferase [Deltaproteobacteria bacterium]MBW1986155.1 serine hydroxymethyltransferase [Deltaproteobacteria bacterium]MBW2134909.1 serine hydroxymethyltransferase [Deltaproteobacteria bacterium]
MTSLAQTDPEIFAAIEQERDRQTHKLELIASENFVSEAVLEAQGSILTHKYAEGYPGRRYYGGCEYVDQAENLALIRVKQLFQAEYANVQPHSGTQANMAVYFAVMAPGDTIMGMDLAHGGHLSHGAIKNFSGQLYRSVTYGLKRDTGEIDFDALEELLQQHRPKILVAGASAYPRIIDFARFGRLAREYGAYLMADIAHIAGIIAAGLHPSPVLEADFVTSTTHKTLRGPRGGLILARGKYGKILDSQIFPGIQGGPLMHTIAAKAVAFKEALRPSFKSYQQQILTNARTMAAEFKQRGYSLVSGGTDNHLLLLDLSSTDLTGQTAEKALDQAGITVNKNAVPFDPRPPIVTSGIRIGTPAVTTRGMKEAEMRQIVDLIHQVLSDPTDSSRLQRIRAQVREFCHQYPLFSPEWEG